MDSKAALEIRARMVGVLLRDARQAAGRTAQECADRLGITAAAYRSCEAGKRGISLPELEILAHALNVPVDHFWGAQTLAAERESEPLPDSAQIIALRQRIIGARLRQARTAAGLSMKALGEPLGLSAGRLSDYEFGARPLPLPELEALAGALGQTIEDFLEARGPIGEWDANRRLLERLASLPPDLRDFIAQPLNESYLRLAMELSRMPANRLRTIAEGLLDITY